MWSSLGHGKLGRDCVLAPFFYFGFIILVALYLWILLLVLLAKGRGTFILRPEEYNEVFFINYFWRNLEKL